MQGSIRRRSEGHWQVRQGTKRDAQRVLAELVAAVDQKLIGASSSITVAELLNR